MWAYLWWYVWFGWFFKFTYRKPEINVLISYKYVFFVKIDLNAIMKNKIILGRTFKNNET